MSNIAGCSSNWTRSPTPPSAIQRVVTSRPTPDRLQALATAHDASIIHAASNYLNGAAAAAAGRALGIASIYEVRGLWHLTRAFSEPGYDHTEHYRYCERREVAACAAVDHVITLSEGLRQWLVERGIPAHKISIVGNATHVPGGSAQDREADAHAVRERHRIPASAKVIGYLGAIVEYEGLDALIRAHARTPGAHRPFLLIVGGGESEAVLRRMVAALGTRHQVMFAGHVSPDEVPAHYAGNGRSHAAAPRRHPDAPGAAYQAVRSACTWAQVVRQPGAGEGARGYAARVCRAVEACRIRSRVPKWWKRSVHVAGRAQVAVLRVGVPHRRRLQANAAARTPAVAYAACRARVRPRSGPG